jgi:hypothetical protein
MVINTWIGLDNLTITHNGYSNEYTKHITIWILPKSNIINLKSY